MSWGRRALLAGLSALPAACSPATLLNTTVPRDGYTREADIAYGPAPRQKLDLYRPETPQPDGKVVVFFYGGSWDSGSKDDYLFVAQALAAQGYTVVIPDYRLYPEVRFPAFVEDGARAVRWSADRFGVDRLVVMGHSAGAHIALMLAANTPYLAAAGVDRTRLRGAVGLSGPYDFLPLTSARLIDIFGSANDPRIEAITFARAPLPPALLIHGTADTTVLPRNSINLAAAWRAAGAPVELKLYPGVGHVDVVAAMADLLSGRAPTRTDVLAWLETA
ncbi:alpha/beta hydrolase [Reyranella sp.]|uniref:alpha/beta hydrolase n=1 Tax=Reyranella sp. TaxID=1929291 RepID=UPI003BA9FED0